MKKTTKMMTVLAAAAMAAMPAISAGAAEQKDAYYYTSGEVEFKVGDSWNRVHRALGAENDIKTLANCANGGSDKCYLYDDCDIYVTQDAKKQLIIDKVILKGEAVTEEGLKFGQTPKDVKKAYPEAKSEYSNGIYTAELGGMQIVIDCGMDDNAVVDISYELKE